ncbi:Transmembrane protein 184C-like protein, partial [Dinothrombium tinctorium]
IFAWIAFFVAIYEIAQHLIHFNKPYLQKYVIRILWMVPIYAMNSWLALTYPPVAIYLDTLRECYEAYAIYSFMKYLLNFLYCEMDIETTIDTKPPVKHIMPLNFLPPMPGGRLFLYRCKHGILQYAVLRPITTILTLITQLIGIYGEGKYDFKHFFLYFLIINNLSQMTAMYFLALFYNAYKNELSSMKPLLKFLCIKAVIFMSFFQQVVISLLIEVGVIKSAFGVLESKNAIGRNLQDFLICFEMFVAAIVHLFAFSHYPFIDTTAANDPTCYSIMRILDFSDERSDVNDHFRQIWLGLKNTVSKRNGSQSSCSSLYDESSILIPLKPTSSASQPVKNYDSNRSSAII